MKSLENLGVQALSARFMLGKACKESQTAWGEGAKCQNATQNAWGWGFTLSLSLSLSLSRLSVLPILPHYRLLTA